ncbi:DNA cytosine methyltransferase, partial [Acinetobacter baumannii]
MSEIKPICFVAENVPGILSARNKPLIDVAFGLVRKDYTLLPPMKITASDYGAPTSRTRVFFIGHLKTSPFKITTADFAPNSICPVLVGHALEG